MDDLIEISEIFLIKNNDALGNINASKWVTKVGSQLFIFHHLSLTTLKELESLKEDHQILITNKINLTNIGALGGIISTSDV